MRRKNKKPIEYIDLRQLDSDKDGLSDYEEINIFGTDPSNADTDNDGIGDGQDLHSGFNPRNYSLKNLFIPWAGNQYQPHFLKPKRLAFYSFSAVLIKLIIVSFVFFVPITAFLTPDILTQESKKVIELTNKVRTSLALNPLKESSRLDQAALGKAQDMLLQQYFAHVGPDQKNLTDWLAASGYRYDIAGENLALGFANASDVVDAWTKSKTHYANIIDPDFSEIGVGMISGVYSEKDTTLVAQYFGSPRPTAVEDKVTATITQPQTVPKTTAVAPKPAEPPKTTTTIPTKTIVKADTTKTTVGLTKVSMVVEPKPAEVKKPEVVVVAPVETPPEVKPVEKKVELSPLLAPSIVLPENNSVVNQLPVDLKILAPQADKVIVYKKYSVIASSTDLVNGLTTVSVNLDEGPNQINVKSYRGWEFKVSPDYNFNLDLTAPIIDSTKSKVVVSEPVSGSERVVKAIAYVSSDVKSAKAYFSNYQIDLSLSKDESGQDAWIGQAIIFDYKDEKLFNTVTMPNIVLQDWAGNTATYDIAWDKVVPVKPSLLKQYFFVKSYPLINTVAWLFNISGWLYKLVLIMAIIALLLNVFVEIKKQYPKIIFSTLGFIFLLTILVIV
ncbi:MAG: CAP domain-containing protein [Candidatus Buchananbacteria bacterium]